MNELHEQVAWTSYTKKLHRTKFEKKKFCKEKTSKVVEKKSFKEKKSLERKDVKKKKVVTKNSSERKKKVSICCEIVLGVNFPRTARDT